jgi:purine-binding chemotaxis protein CheW
MQKQWLCFLLDNEWYLQDVSGVREVVPFEEPSPVPGSPAESMGILDIRGDIITIFCGRSLLSLPATEDRQHAKIVILDSDDGVFGVAVDDVGQILTLEDEQIEHTLGNPQNHPIQGTIQHQDKLFVHIDLGRCEQIAGNSQEAL